MYKDIIIKIATEANISKCFSLEEIGIDNYAFPYVSILGGDVYLKRGSSIDISYDNWYCDKKEDEQDSVFVNRSCDVAETFIKEYKRKNIVKEPLFAFVIGEQYNRNVIKDKNGTSLQRIRKQQDVECCSPSDKRFS